MASSSQRPPAASAGPPAFADRAEAGARLGVALRAALAEIKFEDMERTRVFAIPRGGVAVGAGVARVLRAPLDVVVVRKIGHPDAPEFGLGAIAEGVEPVFDEGALAEVGLRVADLAGVVARERVELARRVAVYRGVSGGGLDVTGGMLAIVVDDGLATGVTARAALRAVRARIGVGTGGGLSATSGASAAGGPGADNSGAGGDSGGGAGAGPGGSPGADDGLGPAGGAGSGSGADGGLGPAGGAGPGAGSGFGPGAAGGLAAAAGPGAADPEFRSQKPRHEIPDISAFEPGVLPVRIVLAVPVGAAASIEAVKEEADEVVTVVTPRRLRSVGEWYADFGQLTDADVLTLLAASSP